MGKKSLKSPLNGSMRHDDICDSRGQLHLETDTEALEQDFPNNQYKCWECYCDDITNPNYDESEEEEDNEDPTDKKCKFCNARMCWERDPKTIGMKETRERYYCTHCDVYFDTDGTTILDKKTSW